MRRLIVIATEGYSREDGNIYYSRYCMVSSDVLSFNEPVFTDPDSPLRAKRSVGDDSSDERMTGIENAIRDLGYTVEEVDPIFIEVFTG
jgi:hypothetical protein